MQASVLIVDDETILTAHLKTLLERKGYEVSCAASAKQARALMEQIDPDVALIDLRLPDADGIELIAEFKAAYEETRFIVITAYASIESAVKSTRQGAVDYLTKPFDPEALLLTINNAMKSKILTEEVRRLRSLQRLPLGDPHQGDGCPYPSETMREVFSLAGRAASRQGIVLLLGESGTGKDYLARWIHRHSPRADGPFFSINCAAVTRELAESELFGHEPGAFTGTRGRKRGMLELADGGTILLDEIGEMDLTLQSKLLTFLDTKSFLRVGGERRIEIDTRILAATNKRLADEVQGGHFRQDLFYRLNVMPIELPPLRQRIDDLPRLVAELVGALTEELGPDTRYDISPGALDALSRYPWPGNIRELRNALERAMITSADGRLQMEHFNLSQVEAERDWQLQIGFPDPGQSLHDVTQSVARKIISEALRRTKTKSAAAKLLGITRDSLNYQIKTLSL